MAEKEAKKGPKWLAEVLENALVRLVIVAVTALLAGSGATGWAMSGDQDTTRRLDAQDKRIDTLEIRVFRMERQQMDFFSAQVEADSSLRAVLERRAIDKQKAAAERKAVETLINLGGTP